jgi:hypothetical protein
MKKKNPHNLVPKEVVAINVSPLQIDATPEDVIKKSTIHCVGKGKERITH